MLTILSVHWWVRIVVNKTMLSSRFGCFLQVYILICLLLQLYICPYLPVCIENSIFLLPCICELTVRPYHVLSAVYDHYTYHPSCNGQMLTHQGFCDILCNYLGEGRPRFCSSVFYQAAAFCMWLNLPMCLPIGCWFQGCFMYILKFSYFLSYFDTIQYPFTYISCCSLCSALGYGIVARWSGVHETLFMEPPHSLRFCLPYSLL